MLGNLGRESVYKPALEERNNSQQVFVGSFI